MKNKILFLIALFLTFGLALPAAINADNDNNNGKNEETLQNQIEKLQKKITEIQAKIQELQVNKTDDDDEEDEDEDEDEDENGNNKSSESSITIKINSPIFSVHLRRGLSSEEVESLQVFLSQYPDIYPEGLITGYFGALTEKAVKKFQKKYGEDNDGVVGPKTRQMLNLRILELLNEGAGKSGKIPPGLLHAPGIWKKIATSTPPILDTIPPVISGISATSTTATTTSIIWTTNELTDSLVSYATSSPITPENKTDVSDSNYVTNHDIDLIDLTASTTYYYMITSKDSSNNTATSTEYSFTTIP
jgi:hypothetical protein